MHFIRDSFVNPVLNSSCINLYTPGLRARFPRSHKKTTISELLIVIF